MDTQPPLYVIVLTPWTLWGRLAGAPRGTAEFTLSRRVLNRSGEAQNRPLTVTARNELLIPELLKPCALSKRSATPKR